MSATVRAYGEDATWPSCAVPEQAERHTSAQPLLADVPCQPEQPVQPASFPLRDISHLNATAGFALLDADGAVLDWHPCILDACDAFKARKLARRIVRVADGCVMRFRVCKAKASRYEEARAA